MTNRIFLTRCDKIQAAAADKRTWGLDLNSEQIVQIVHAENQVRENYGSSLDLVRFAFEQFANGREFETSEQLFWAWERVSTTLEY